MSFVFADLKPIPPDPLPVFNTTQYSWQHRYLLFKDADVRYFKIDTPDIVAPEGGSFGVSTVRLQGDQVSCEGSVSGFSTPSSGGVKQLDLINFSSNKLTFSSNANGPVEKLLVLHDDSTGLTSGGAFIKRGDEMNVIYKRMFRPGLVNRILTGPFPSAGGFLGQVFDTVIFDRPTTTGLTIPRIIACFVGQGNVSTTSGAWRVTTSTTATAIRTGWWYGISYSVLRDIIVMVGGGPNVGASARSLDGGFNFTSSNSLPNLAANRVYTSVCYSIDLDLFCTVSRSTVSNFCAVSADGDTWTSAPSGFVGLEYVCWSSKYMIFCAVGNNGLIITSPDGLNWTQQTSPNSNKINYVSWSDDMEMFICCCSPGVTNNQIHYSYDGITWFNTTTPENATYHSAKYISQLGVFVAVSSDGNFPLISSNDGINWVARNSLSPGLVLRTIDFNPRTNRLILLSNRYLPSGAGPQETRTSPRVGFPRE
jgi:hypothetical protein